MINIDCNDGFISKSLFEVLAQRYNFKLNKENNSFKTLKVSIKNDFIFFELAEQKINFRLPLDFKSFLQNFHYFIKNVNFTIDKFTYFPLQSLIQNDIKKIVLTDIQNELFSILLSYKNGILKENLYKLIWPKDKILSLNKIETHLTNLKNYLKGELDLNIQISSNNKLIKLNIN